MTQAVEYLPDDALLAWVSDQVPGISCPADRPWFLVPPPTTPDDSFSCLCPCGRHGPVALTRVACTDGQSHIWLGQCQWPGAVSVAGRCHKIIWAFVRAKAT